MLLLHGPAKDVHAMRHATQKHLPNAVVGVQVQLLLPSSPFVRRTVWQQPTDGRRFPFCSSQLRTTLVEAVIRLLDYAVKHQENKKINK